VPPHIQLPWKTVKSDRLSKGREDSDVSVGRLHSKGLGPYREGMPLQLQRPYRSCELHLLLRSWDDLALAPDDCTVRIWDMMTGRYTRTLKGHTKSVKSIAFSNYGNMLAAGSIDGTVRLWDMTTEKNPGLCGTAPPRTYCPLRTHR
jgi:WD40 repeat protein